MTRRFEKIEDGSAKFWEISVEGSAVTVRFGKLGTAGQQKVKDTGSQAGATKEAEKLVREKTGKGYVEIGGGAATTAGHAPAALPEPKAEPGVTTAELELFRALRGKSAFFGDPDFGEVAFLSPAATPRMRAHRPEAPMWDRADWVAEEADDAVLGYLRISGLATSERPVVILDNEGCLHLTGACLVDHFGSYPSAAQDEEALEPLRKLCEKHGLPRWRTRETLDAMARELGLAELDVTRAPALDVAAWRAAVEKTRPGAATKAPKPPKSTSAKGKGTRPLKGSSIALRTGLTREGQPWSLSPETSRSTLHVWNGTGFAVRDAVPGFASTYACDANDELFVASEAAQRKTRDGTFTPVQVPERLTALSGEGRGSIYGIGDSGTLHRWTGEAFVAVSGVTPRRGATLARDKEGALYVVGGRSPDLKSAIDVPVRVAGDAVEKLPRLVDRDPILHALVAGDRLVALGSCLHVLDRGAKRWRSSAPLNAPGWLVALDDDEVVVLRQLDLDLHAFDLSSLVPRVAGTLLLKPNTSTAAVGDGRGTILVLGGALGTDRNYKVAAEPQIWSKPEGRTRAVAGCEKELEEQIELQAKKLLLFRKWSGPILPPS